MRIYPKRLILCKAMMNEYPLSRRASEMDASLLT